VAYAPYLTGGIILVVALGILVGMFALMKPAAVVKGQELSWVRVVFWSLGFALLVVGVAAVAHWLEHKRYTAPLA
jgi:cytochrome c oxidase assembly factor CtaG